METFPENIQLLPRSVVIRLAIDVLLTVIVLRCVFSLINEATICSCLKPLLDAPRADLNQLSPVLRLSHFNMYVQVIVRPFSVVWFWQSRRIQQLLHSWEVWRNDPAKRMLCNTWPSDQQLLFKVCTHQTTGSSSGVNRALTHLAHCRATVVLS